MTRAAIVVLGTVKRGRWKCTAVTQAMSIGKVLRDGVSTVSQDGGGAAFEPCGKYRLSTKANSIRRFRVSTRKRPFRFGSDGASQLFVNYDLIILGQGGTSEPQLP